MSIAQAVNLKEGEEIIYVVRETWLNSLPRFLTPLIPAVLVGIYWQKFSTWGIMGGIIAGAIIVVSAYISLRRWISWRYTIFVVTNRRVVDIHQPSFFVRLVAEVSFNSIQDVAYRKEGIMETLCDYGTVTIQTAGMAKNIEVVGAGNPAELQSLVNRLRRQDPAGVSTRRAQAVKEFESASEEDDDDNNNDEAIDSSEEIEERKKQQALGAFFKKE